MALACSNLAQVLSSAGSANPHTTASGSVNVTAGNLLIVTCEGNSFSSAATPAFTISATGGSWSWVNIGSALANGAYSMSTHGFAGVVPVGVSSTVISVTITDATATELTVLFNVDKISGQGTLPGTLNQIVATKNYTGTPGANLPNGPASTSLVYSWLIDDGTAPADVTAQPSGFTETALFDDIAINGLWTLGCAYKIGSASQGPNNWTRTSGANLGIVGYLEVPVATGATNATPALSPASAAGVAAIPKVGAYPPVA